MKNITAGEPASSIANPSGTAFRTKHAASSDTAGESLSTHPSERRKIRYDDVDSDDSDCHVATNCGNYQHCA